MAHLIDLHILQSFPVSCLNRDENGQPKTAIFGGVPRGQVTSQCQKAAERSYLQREESPYKLNFANHRTRRIADVFRESLVEAGMNKEKATDVAANLRMALGKDDKKDKKGDEEDKKSDEEDSADEEMDESKVLLNLSRDEIDAVSKHVVALDKAGKLDSFVKAEIKKVKGKDKKKVVLDQKTFATIVMNAKPTDNVDIAVFSRMLAAIPRLNVDGALSSSHAFTTHAVEIELDFFTAMTQAEEHAAMIDYSMFMSGTFYRNFSFDLNQFARNLPLCKSDKLREYLREVLTAIMIVIPGARQRSMLSSAMPEYALITVRDASYPLSLANAFERPIPGSSEGYLQPSIANLKNYWEKTKKAWGSKLGIKYEGEFPSMGVESLIEKVVGYAYAK